MGCALVLAAGAAFVTVAWPYLLATYVAVRMGAASPSPARTVAGWTAEFLYAVALIAVLVAARRRNAELARRAEAEEAEAARRQLRRTAALARLAVRQMEAVAETGDLRSAVWDFDHVGLVEPRVAYRGGPKVQQVVDRGHLSISAKGVRYASSTRNREWLFSKLDDSRIDGNLLLMHVSNRTVVSGVTAAPAEVRTIAGVVRFVDDRLAGLDGLDAVSDLESVILEVERQARVARSAARA